MENKPAPITDLPLDVLLLIFPYLDVKSFLALCSTCKALHQPSIRLEPSYWRNATRSTFRVPNQPVVENDGARWQRMYRRLLTQTRVYTWGSNGHTRLGHSYAPDAHGLMTPRAPRLGLPLAGARRQNRAPVGVPTEMEDTRHLGVIADMQCGGWSTSLLTSKGTLHTAGVMDGQRVLRSPHRLKRLAFPDDVQQDGIAATIRSFSAGRSHILALADDGRIWSWNDADQPAIHVRFTSIDTKEASTASEDQPSSSYGVVRQVVAGWSRSSAYVQGVGIVLWDIAERERGHNETAAVPTLEHGEVPKTGYRRLKDTSGESEYEKALGSEVGAVLNYIILEHFVVFNTDIGRVFCGRFGDDNNVEDVVELRQLRTEAGLPFDVQGSFSRFAVFSNRQVMTAEQGYLEACWAARHTDTEQAEIRGLERIPALQHKDIIQIAFGDYHYLALHSSGKITSYGSEMHGCGALGLGDGTSHSEEAYARGVTYDRANFARNAHVPTLAYQTHGRQVWFDGRKRDWLDHIVNGRADPAESEERRAMFRTNPRVHAEVSEWIEQESRAWDDAEDEDGLGAYFALGVSAAGWHSGALVLVNEELADKKPAYSWEQMRFPRLRLADGTEMPGEKEFDEWRDGRPEWP